MAYSLPRLQDAEVKPPATDPSGGLTPAGAAAIYAPLASPALTGTPTINGVQVAKLTDIPAGGGGTAAAGPAPLNALGNKLSKVGVVIPNGTTATHDDLLAESLSVLYTAETGQLAGVYTGYSAVSGAQRGAVCLAWSDDGLTWAKSGPTLSYSGSGPDSNGATGPSLVYDNGLYYLFYIGLTATGYEGGIKSLCLATSPTLVNPSWSRRGTVMAPGGTAWRSQNIWHPSVVKVGTTWYCFVNATGADGKETIGYATASNLAGPWTFDDANSPLIANRTGEPITGDPAVTRVPGGYRMDFFRVNSGYTAAWDFYATTTDALFPLGWRVGNGGNPILSPTAGSYDAKFAHKPVILVMGGRTYHYYTAVNASDARVVALAVDPPLATSSTPAVSNTVAPAITGTATTGNVLTVSNGTWSATPDSYSYTWNRAGSPIAGATAATYTLVTADVGQAVTATVTAVKAGYTSGTATSAAVTPAAPAGGGAPAGAVAYDTFTRANSTSLGSTETGAFAWQTSGAGWAITSNALAWTGTTDQVAMVNTGVSDWTMQFTAVSLTGAYPLTFVWGSGTGTAAYSKIYRENASNGWKLATGGGANATIRNTNAPVSGDVFKLVKAGGTLTLSANGTQIAQWTGWASNVSAGDTWQGIGGAGNIGLTVDTFSVTSP